MLSIFAKFLQSLYAPQIQYSVVRSCTRRVKPQTHHIAFVNTLFRHSLNKCGFSKKLRAIHSIYKNIAVCKGEMLAFLFTYTKSLQLCPTGDFAIVKSVYAN